jgi:hypothetical protein
MSDIAKDDLRRFYAETYDTVMSDWPGEIEFYQSLAEKYVKKAQSVLEIACGTGRNSNQAKQK